MAKQQKKKAAKAVKKAPAKATPKKAARRRAAAKHKTAAPKAKRVAKKTAAKRALAKKAAIKTPPTAKKVLVRAAVTKKARAPGVNENLRNKDRARAFAAQLEGTRRGREDGAHAFVGEDGSSDDDMAVEMGRDFLTAAETGKEVLEELSDEEGEEESGGPFVETSGKVEFGLEPDGSNPEDAERAPFPTANRSR